jgi:MinD superfamily P-loop ATPase
MNNIKEIAVISGKGGTGKTSILGSLACLAKNKILADCDVDAADLHLILGGKINSSNEFIGGKKAQIINDKCNDCGMCIEYCRFHAIKDKFDRLSKISETYIDKFSCEGCGVCLSFCPENAIELKDHMSGQWFTSETKYGPLVHARLGIAEANSGKLVSLLRKTAINIAEKNNYEYIFIDGSPGIGCPVIASLTGVDYALIVTEPTLSAIHDMKRISELTRHFGIKSGICINKCDINLRLCDLIEQFSHNNKIKILSKIPYNTDITKAQITGVPYLEYTDNGIADNIKELWEKLKLEIDLLKIELKNNKPIQLN